MSTTGARFWCAALLALTALGCGKTGKVGPGAPAVPGGAAGAAGTPAVLEPDACATPQPGPSPMLRLDTAQLESTVRDLFRDVPAVVSKLESTFARLPGNYGYGEGASPPNNELVDAYHALAHEAGLALLEDPPSLVKFAGCDPAQSDEATCRDAFVSRFLRHTSRRPATPDETAEALAVFATGQELGGGEFASGVRAVVEVVLQGPDFLYLVQQGEGDAHDGVIALSGYETATRLAYLLTGSMPDAELLAAADEGGFDDARLEAQARRLLGSAPNRRLVRQFMARLLRYQGSGSTDSALYPSYTPQVAAHTREESGRFVEDVVFDGAGTFRALFAERSTWLNRPLSVFYGFGGVTREEFQKVDVSDQQRAGILTQSAFLTATSPGGRPNPVMRGLVVARDVLCLELAPPINIPPVISPEAPENTTFRSKLELATSDPACEACHIDINPAGFAFENYDGVGLWRDLDNGLPIDASGTLYKSDAKGDFVGALELVERIAESQDAQACFVGNWLNMAYGRRATEDDACARTDVETIFRDSDGKIVDLLVALAKTDQLRYRLASELAP